MIRRPFATGLLIVALTASFVPLGPAVSAQSGGQLDLIAQTLVVDDGPVELVFRVGGAPDDARLEITIFRRPIRGIDELRSRHRARTSGGAQLAFFDCTLDGDCNDEAALVAGAGGRYTLTLREDRIGEALRSNSGALAVRVRLLDEGGDELDQLAMSLVIPSVDAATVQIAFVGRIAAPVAIQPDSSVRLDVAQLQEDAAALEAHPALPVAIHVVPETLEALAGVDPGLFAEIIEIIGDRPLLRTPWVEMDEEAWRSVDEGAAVVQQYARGNDVLESIIGRPPTDLVRLDPDAGPASLGLLRSAGTGAVIVADAQLEMTPGGTEALRPFQLVDDNGVSIPALRIDGSLHETLDQSDPYLAAYQALSELMIAAMTQEDELGVLLDLDRIDPATLGVLLDHIDDIAELEVVPPRSLLDLDLARADDGSLLRGELAPDDPADVGPLAGQIEASSAWVDMLATMVEPERDPVEPLRDRLLAAASSSLTGDTAVAYTRSVTKAVLAATSGIDIAPGERTTLTDRRSDLPLTITNRQPFPVNVELRLSAEKIRFLDGERRSIRLEPGANRIVIPVETLASGDARVTATLSSPDGRLELSTGTVDIRSTAISGLGLLISIAALVVLGAWWIRTIQRIRRNRAAATVAPAAVSTREDAVVVPTREDGEMPPQESET